ncbi:hypothetical protein AGRA3207_004513 [Actinomadura graeca]|uniref:DUF3995 domain-containing protein n=1 Tax=Actinomadura graeca TaxID=2750812 RepID=A0ABX8QX07_9ACTN|nr:hypothetical protein [Actinomadura graeca]QXJ23369.1 hypothetical protein AGRA3207_004513 [Actinomadura graeca]
MTSTSRHSASSSPAPSVSDLPDLPDLPRWARWTAHASALAPLPSGLWRIAMAAGVPVGFDQAWLQEARMPGRGSVWPILLSLVTECCALLALGLVRPWGERVPAWIPFAGGRRVPPPAALIPAWCATAILTGFGAAFAIKIVRVLGGHGSDPSFPEGTAAWVMSATYVPMLAWGPLLGLTAFAYQRRRRAAAARTGSRGRRYRRR